MTDDALGKPAADMGPPQSVGNNAAGSEASLGRGKPYGRAIRPGDLINLDISNVTYQGYNAQTARMIAVGDITRRREEVLAVCTEGVKRAKKLIRPGGLVSEINNAACEPYIEHGLLTAPEARTMPYNWAPGDDGGPRPRQPVADAGWAPCPTGQKGASRDRVD